MDGLNLDVFRGNLIHIANNIALTNVDALETIQHIVCLQIHSNANLLNIDGFQQVIDISGFLSIKNHKALQNVDGLRNVLN